VKLWRSLTFRLSVFFTLAASFVLVSMGLIVLNATRHHFIELDALAIGDKHRLIAAILAQSASLADAQGRLREALGHHHGLYVQVSAGPELLWQSSGWIKPDNPRPLSVASSHGDVSVLIWKSRGKEFHGQRETLAAAFASQGPLEVWVALDTEHHERFMLEQRRTWVGVGLLALGAFGLLAYLAAYQGLRPLRALIDRARSVSGERLDQRLIAPDMPLEIAVLADALNAMLARLQDDFQRLQDFSTDLAHELRTPISNLRLQAEVTLSAERNVDTYRHALLSCMEELDRLARTVADMLYLAKTERRQTLPHPDTFAIAAEWRALADFYDALTAEQKGTLQVRGDATIVADRLMFRRAISNLLSNAIRHADTDSQIEVDIATNTAGDEVTITVTNQGDTIDSKDLPRLFDRFYRADPARQSRPGEGAGLGLAITRAIIDAHGGRVSVSSAARKTVFTVVLPVRGMFSVG
jgi:two-component system, OmpR family, heavy metal sensor histidine kinase CusS